MNSWKAIFSCLVLFFLTSCSPLNETSNQNKVVEEKVEEEHRIIATTLAITEILDRLDLEVIGIPTTQYTIPERYKNVTQVGNPMSPDLEIVKTLNPTEVFSVSTLAYDLRDSFEKMNIPATFLNLESVSNMLESISWIGKEYEREKEAEALVSSIKAKIEKVATNTKSTEKPSVLILLGVPGGSYLVATENSYVGNLVEVVGGVNAIEGQTAEYISANTEYLQQSNPDVILRLSHGIPDQVVKEFNQEFAENNIWKHFNAVKNNRVYDLEEPIFATTANLHINEALDRLQNMLFE